MRYIKWLLLQLSSTIVTWMFQVIIMKFSLEFCFSQSLLMQFKVDCSPCNQTFVIIINECFTSLWRNPPHFSLTNSLATFQVFQVESVHLMSWHSISILKKTTRQKLVNGLKGSGISVTKKTMVTHYAIMDWNLAVPTSSLSAMHLQITRSSPFCANKQLQFVCHGKILIA